MAKLDLNSLKNLQSKGEAEVTPVVAEAEKAVEKPVEPVVVASASPKLSLNALKKSSGLSVSSTSAPVVESTMQPITIQKPIIENKTEETVIEAKETEETASFFGMSQETIAVEAGSDTDVITEPVAPIHENIVTELEEIISEGVTEVTEVLDEPAISEESKQESSVQEAPKMPAEFFPNLNVLEDLELQDVLSSDETESLGSSSKSIFADKEVTAAEPVMLVSDPAPVAQESIIPAVEPAEEKAETIEAVVEMPVEEVEIVAEETPVVDVSSEKAVEDVQVLEIPSDSMVLTPESIDPQYVEQVKGDLSSERKGGLVYLKNKKVLIGLGVFAVFSLGFSFFAFGILGGVPEGKTNVQESIETTVPSQADATIENHDVAPVVASWAEDNAADPQEIEVMENESDSPQVYQEGIDYQVIIKKKKNTTNSGAEGNGSVIN